MSFWSNAEITGAERLKCLEYYEAEVGVTAFQTQEADLFNAVLVTHNDVLQDDPAAASQVCNAAQRLVQASNEIIRRRDAIRPVPEAAYALHWAWHVTSVAYAAWARATLSAMESLANGMKPLYTYVQHLVSEHETAWNKAQKEEKKFLKQLRIPSSEVTKIVDKSIKAAENDGWQPEHPAIMSDEEVTSETIVNSCS